MCTGTDLELGLATAINFLDLLSVSGVLVDDIYCFSRSDFVGLAAIVFFPGLTCVNNPILCLAVYIARA